VYVVHGFGHTSKSMRASYLKGIDDAGLITRFSRDPIMGGTGMRGNFVTVTKVDGPAPGAHGEEVA